MSPTGLSRRQLLSLAGVAGGALALPGAASAAPGRDPVAALYHDVLLLHTRWMEMQWDERIDAYQAADFRFVGVLGNAVLLTTPGYDEKKAGITHGRLKSRTLATIKRFAATNRLAGGTEWGKQLFWDSTFELYFVLAARLLWQDLDERTRADVQAITIGQAAYAYALGTGDDPMSVGWSPNGRDGGYRGDTKLEEMGVYAQALAPGIAWAEDDGWRRRFEFWVSNSSGLPVADRANPAIKPANTAQNIHDTFIVENHGSANPHYQAELWRTAGRAAIHFMTAGVRVPAVLTHQPNGRELWATLMLLASDAGEPVMPAAADRYHLYGRDVLPLAFLAQVQGDPNAARAEADLAVRLKPYLLYDPEYRLTKFSGEDKYEPEARAELAIAYLFHRHRRSPVRPASPAAFFAAAAGTRDFGDDVGVIAHQSPAAFAAAVTKDEFVNFLWQPGHDNWLVDTRASAFLPPGASPPTAAWTTTYRKDRDGLDGTATVLSFGEQYAGFTTLPTGTVVYESTGVGADEGGLTLFNMSMPGVPGLTGSRTFTAASGKITLGGSRGGGGDGGADELAFPARHARYVRMLGKQAANQYGYSIWSFSVLDTSGADLAQGAVATGSSADVTYPAYNATDGNPKTRWAVAADQRGRVDSWLAVDLGSVVTIAGVRILWESAYATEYVIQTSTDAVTWSLAVAVPDAYTLTGGWVDIDGRAGLVTHESYRPIMVTATGVIAGSGGPASTTVEGYVGGRTDLARAANRTMPATASGLRVNDADGYLSIFNLTDEAVTGGKVWLPTATRLYRGTQFTVADGLEFTVTQAGGTARLEPPRFQVEGRAPVGTCFYIPDSRHVTVTAPADAPVAVTLRAGSWSAKVRLSVGSSRTLVVPGGPPTPTPDLARCRTTFPTSPLPAGMTSPENAVDGNPATSWRPGSPAARMVVDLGAVVEVSAVGMAWSKGWVCPVRLESSTDGDTYTPVDLLPQPARVTTTAVDVSARYVAVSVVGWRPGDAELVTLTVA